MVPAGYLFKRVVPRPDWLQAAQVDDVYSVSGHVAADFADYVSFWKHNGFWLFDAPAVMEALARAHDLDLTGATLFYYEVFEAAFDAAARTWAQVGPEPSLTTHVERPRSARLEGFDVVTVCAGAGPECSPLSCNSLASEIATNRHCLFETFEQARRALETGQFDNTEPGPFRIFAVYTVG